MWTQHRSLSRQPCCSHERAVFNGRLCQRNLEPSLVLYHTERWRVSIESWSCRWTVSRSNPSCFVLLCVSLCRCYPLSLCASLYGFPPMLLACGLMIATASVEQTRLSHLLRPSMFPNMQKCMDIKDNCMSCANWHAIQQIITSCHGSLAFSQQRTRT